MIRTEYETADQQRQADRLRVFERSAHRLIESAEFAAFLAHAELLRLDETNDCSLMETPEAQEILRDVISRLEEYQR